jgi:hypothetical protein
MNAGGAAIAILADDLMWATRLAAAAERAGLSPLPLRGPEALDGLAAPAVVVDLGGRSYDGIDAVRRASSTGVRVLAIGQHDDVGLRKRALAAGAERVLSYRKLFQDGPQVLAAFAGGSTAATAASGAAPRGETGAGRPT